MKTIELLLPLVALHLFAAGCGSMHAEPREVAVSLQVPDLGWSVHIDKIYQVKDELWVIAQLNRRPGMAGQMITTVKDSVNVALPDLPVKYFVLGKTWGWKNKEDYTFLSNRKEIEEKLKAGQKLYDRPEQ